MISNLPQAAYNKELILETMMIEGPAKQQQHMTFTPQFFRVGLGSSAQVTSRPCYCFHIIQMCSIIPVHPTMEFQLGLNLIEA